MALSRISEDENLQEWSLIDLNGKDVIDKMVIGIFEPHSRDNQLIEFQYKLTSRGDILSSASFSLEYVPIPDNFELGQAYPNPFNPRTTLKYGLPVNSELVLSVFDIQGRLVKYLEKGIKHAGYHQVTWDGSQSASGLYFIRMDVYDSDHRLQFNKFQKIMLVK